MFRMTEAVSKYAEGIDRKGRAEYGVTVHKGK